MIAPAKVFTDPDKDSFPDATVSVPVAVWSKDGAITLVPAPPVFSNTPVLSIYEAVEAPSPIPLLSRMS